jgi:UDP-N-acetylmuramate--alanine ligase
MVTKPITTYGFSEEAEVRAVNARANGLQMHFTVIQDGYPDTDFILNQPGMHNVQNACSAIAIAREIGIIDAATQRGLEQFNGVGRRFTRYGDVAIPAEAGGGTFTLVDDFGHHPLETEVTLAAARGAYPGRRLVLAFQPHRFSRTRDLFEDFVKVLSTPDVLLLAEVYAAGESPISAADGRALARALRVGGKIEPIFVEAIGDMPAAIMNAVRDGDVVMTMGAGSISGVPARLTAPKGTP